MSMSSPRRPIRPIRPTSASLLQETPVARPRMSVRSPGRSDYARGGMSVRGRSRSRSPSHSPSPPARRSVVVPVAPMRTSPVAQRPMPARPRSRSQSMSRSPSPVARRSMPVTARSRSPSPIDMSPPRPMSPRRKTRRVYGAPETARPVSPTTYQRRMSPVRSPRRY